MGFTFSLFTNFLVWIQYKIYTHRNFNNQFLLLDLLFKLHPPSRLPNVLIPTKKKKKKDVLQLQRWLFQLSNTKLVHQSCSKLLNSLKILLNQIIITPLLNFWPCFHPATDVVTTSFVALHIKPYLNKMIPSRPTMITSHNSCCEKSRPRVDMCLWVLLIIC